MEQKYTDKYIDKLSKDDRKMFQEASQRHQIFIEMTKRKVQGTNAEALKEHVMGAENLYLQLLNSHPNWQHLVYQLATLYLQTNRNGLCIRLLEPMIAARQKPPIEWVNNVGAAYRNEHMNSEAERFFKQALKQDRQADILANMCALWVNEGSPEKGIPYGREALAMEPNHNQARWNLGLLLMENGEWEEGFGLYAQGFETGERIVRSYINSEGKDTPFWKGQDISGKTIVLHGEQGVGDELLFLQFVPELIKKYPEARIILDVHPRLESAIRRSLVYPQIVGIYPTRKTSADWNAQIPVDYKDGIGSLPAYFWATMGKNAGWLKPDQDLVKYYRDILLKIQAENKQEDCPIIGISWEGGKKKTRNDLRSIELENWKPILNNKCTFVSLQYTPEAAKEVSENQNKTGLEILHWADVTERVDYEHSIALAAATDLVISVNTSIVHVCGSMNHPCWTLTPHGHAWRYGKKEKVLPFYTSVEQFHQKEDESWQRIINKVGFQLMHYTEARRA